MAAQPCLGGAIGVAHETVDLGFEDGGLVRPHGAGEGMGENAHPDRLGSMSQGPRWKISGEYISRQRLSLVGGFGGEGE